MAMMVAMRACTGKAQWLHEQLRGSSQLGWVEFPASPSHFCFRLTGFGDDRFDAVSVSVPSDAMGNRGAELDPSTFEIALFKGSDLAYVDDLGYEDVQRFFSVSDVVDELVRLRAGARGGAGGDDSYDPDGGPAYDPDGPAEDPEDVKE